MKLLTLDEVLALRAGRRLVFTNGVFDVLHSGHVRYLAEARALGDLLIVGMNADATVRQLKGPTRPIHTIADRAFVLSALRSVDGVVEFEERTPEALIAILKPEIHVKGGDYREEDLPEARIVRGYGGEVVLLPFSDGHSTTGILAKLATSETG
ncbi:MAG: D-glycero-beta-D-manno-heptose 1-phosphate adenylyltransferase [Fimbriimonas sp.]